MLADHRLVSLLGGVSAFGFIGIVLGPVVAAVLTALVESYHLADDDEEPEPSAVPPPGATSGTVVVVDPPGAPAEAPPPPADAPAEPTPSGEAQGKG